VEGKRLKLQASITWWLPGGLRIRYEGKPMPRHEWIMKTWRGYVAMWMLIFHAARLLNKD
jgi:hypothetical protein